MKTFIVSLIVLTLITLFVIISSVCLVSADEQLIAAAYKLPTFISDDGFIEPYEAVAAQWNTVRAPMRYIAGNVESDLIDDALGDIFSYYRAHDLAGYLAARERLISTLERIKTAETFSCDSLF